jgi:hypothetical protein
VNCVQGFPRVHGHFFVDSGHDHPSQQVIWCGPANPSQGFGRNIGRSTKFVGRTTTTMFSVKRHDRSVRTIVLLAAFSLVLVNLLSETQSTELRFGAWASAVEQQDVATSSRTDKSAGRSNSRNRHYKPPPMLDGRRLAWDAQQAPMSLLFKDTTLSTTTTSPLETTTRIINGAKAPNRDNYVFSAGSQLCGGTLIHEDIVLTAARTFPGFDQNLVQPVVSLTHLYLVT